MLIATAGHVDHGKTTLIRALTGVDTDRLPEEKKRGLTIDLGFAYITAPSGQRIGFIDVPGHEKFIRNMAAGVGGIDHALLVVAADDGVMPQTREHVAILEMLNVQSCVVAITRIDLVDTATVALIEKEVNTLLQQTTLSVIGTVPVDSVSGRGIDKLASCLNRLAKSDTHSAQGYFRLSVDRSFSIKGAGTVVTGTVVAGAIADADSVLVQPQQRYARVRGIRVNDEVSGKAQRGQRAALNLNGIPATDIKRGDWITDTKLNLTSTCLDVQIQLLDQATLRHWQLLKVHAGAAMFSARIAFFKTRLLEAGQQIYAQIVTEQPQHVLFGDRFVLRNQAGTHTIGGGRVIDPLASRHRAHRKNRLPVLNALSQTDHKRALLDATSLSTAGIDAEGFRLTRNLHRDAFDLLTDTALIARIKSDGMEKLVDTNRLKKTQQLILDLVDQHHQTKPHSAGLSFVHLRDYAKVHRTIFNAAIDHLINDKQIIRLSGNRFSRIQFSPELNPSLQNLLDRLLTIIKPDLIKPPALSALADAMAMDRDHLEQGIRALVDYGALVQVAHNRYYHPEAIETLEVIAKDLSIECGDRGFTARQFAEKSGIGRNLTIELLEYFDSMGKTRLMDTQTKTRTKVPAE